MKRKILSIMIIIALCIGILPITVLVADEGTVYVGGVALTGSEGTPAYATTNDSGEVKTEGATADNYNIMWNGNILTLKGAYITGQVNSGNISGAAIGVENSSGDTGLNIQLENSNTVSASTGIFVLAHPSYTGDASLTITGSGSLTASGTSNEGIRIQSNSGNATLTIQDAEIIASASSDDGVMIQAGESSNASLSVNGGSLTATGAGSNSGIHFQFGNGYSGSGIPSLTVSGNAIVKASGGEGGISVYSSTGIQIGEGDKSSGGIVFDGNKGTVYGDVALQEDLTIGEGESLYIPNGAILNTNGKLTVDGGTLAKNGTVTGGVTYKVTGVSLNTGRLDLKVGDTATITATITPNNAANKDVSWSSDNESVATVDADGKVTAISPGTATITVTTEDENMTATCFVTVVKNYTVDNKPSRRPSKPKDELPDNTDECQDRFGEDYIYSDEYDACIIRYMIPDTSVR